MSKPIISPYLVPTEAEVRQQIRAKIQAAVHEVLAEEIAAVLGSRPYERTARRCGYRHGVETRQMTTENGPATLRVPRARLRQADGSTIEFQSAVLPRYARRTRAVETNRSATPACTTSTGTTTTRRIRCTRRLIASR